MKHTSKKGSPLAGLGFVLLASLGIWFAACGDKGVEILECSGECSCDEDTRTCSCAGGTTCAIEGAEDITFECNGNAACDLTCGVDCHVICPGTTGCTVALGDGGTAECQGTARCIYNCAGDCEITCSGASTCTVNCADDCTQDGTTCRC